MKGNIWRTFSFFLVVMALLTSATAGTYVEKVRSEVAAGKATAQNEADTNDLTIQAASFEAIVSPVHFNLSHDYYFHFTPVFSDVFLKFTGYILKQPAIIVTYLKNTFGHLIAINAP
jgi:hypothetical protein